MDESLVDRISALKDVIPPTYRKNLANFAGTGYDWASRAMALGGKTLWVVSTSALLLGVPWALAFSEEQQVQEMEREMRMQQSANEVGSTSRREADGRCANNITFRFLRLVVRRNKTQSLRCRPTMRWCTLCMSNKWAL